MAKAVTDDQSDDLVALQVKTNVQIAQALDQLVKQAPPEDIGYAHPKYQQRLRDEGVFTVFAAPVFQNGKEAQARGLKADTVERAPKIRPGVYLGGRVEVVRTARGGVNLIYRSARPDDRTKFGKLVVDFDDLIEKLWAEMQAKPAPAA